MRIERFGTSLQTTSDVALENFGIAAYCVMAHRPGADDALTEALTADPACVGAWAFKGLCHALLAREAAIEVAKTHLASARAAMKINRFTEDEHALVQALQHAVDGSLRRSAKLLEERIHIRPHLMLMAKLAHALRFMSGDLDGLTTGVEIVLRGNSPYADGFGFMLGCRAFGYEERGDFLRATEIGLEAIEQQPDDAWAIHAVSHVYEMTGRPEAGTIFIERHRPIWTRCNNFALHMSWHAALFQLERRNFHAALAIFDEEVWPRASNDFRDISNAVSLLFRLESHGVSVGGRWRSVADAAASQVADRTYAFACLHNLVALMAAGRLERASALLSAMKRPASPANEQEQVFRKVGRPVADLLCKSATRSRGGFNPEPLIAALPELGGSAAQRDLFVRILANHAAKMRNWDGLTRILSSRAKLRADDHFARIKRADMPTDIKIPA